MKKHFSVVKKISFQTQMSVFPTIYNHALQNKRFSTSKSFKFFAQIKLIHRDFLHRERTAR